MPQPATPSNTRRAGRSADGRRASVTTDRNGVPAPTGPATAATAATDAAAAASSGLGLRSPDSPVAYRVVAAALLLLGLGLWYALRVKSPLLPGVDDVPTGLGSTFLNVWGLVALLALVPTIRRGVGATLARIADPSPARRRIATLAVAVGAAALFLFLELVQGHDLLPSWHDEQSYALGARMLASGRLWMPAHPLARFFDSFYIFVEPVYASMYFPGAALMYVPAVWLGLPTSLLSAAIGGGVVGLTYRVVGELVDGAAGAVGAACVAACTPLQVLSAMTMSHPPLMLLTLLAAWAWLHWRRTIGDGAVGVGTVAGWAGAMGVFAGWAAITRPLDAACLLLPVGVAVLVRLARRGSGRTWALTVAAGLLGLAPFSALQAVQNWGLTGSWHRYPHDLYVSRDMPGVEFGFHSPDPTARPASDLPQKQVFHQTWTYPAALRHQPDQLVWQWWNVRLPYVGASTLPNVALATLVPLGLLGLAGIAGAGGSRGNGPGGVARGEGWAALLVLPAGVPLYLGAYVFYAFFMGYYPMVLAPAFALALAASPVAAARALPPRWRLGTVAAVALLVAGACAGQVASRVASGDYPNEFSTELAMIDAELAAIDRPAVVLFRFERGNTPHAEPVYNTSVAWPDDALVVRAHDRGPDNAALIRYYGTRQPGRDVFLYLRGPARAEHLVRLGTAGDLMARLRPNTPAPAAPPVAGPS